MSEIQMIDTQGITRWTNPPGKPTVRFRLRKHPPVYRNKVCIDKGYIDVEIPAGKTIGLPSEYDDAVQKRDASGMIQSGRCPWLIRNGEPAPMHPALDPNAAAREEAAAREKAAKETLEKAEAERRAAEAERAAAEAQSRAAEESAAAVAAKEKAEKSGKSGKASS